MDKLEEAEFKLDIANEMLANFCKLVEAELGRKKTLMMLMEAEKKMQMDLIDQLMDDEPSQEERS